MKKADISGKRCRFFLVLLAVLWIFVSGLLLAAPQPENHRYLNIEIVNDRVSADFKDVDLRQVLTILSQKAGFHLIMGDDLSGFVNLTIRDAPLEEVLKQLCRNRAIEYRYEPETGGYRIIGTGAFAGNHGDDPDNVRSSSSELSASPLPNLMETGSPPEGADGENPRDSQGRLLYQPRELLVKFRDGVPKDEIEALHRAAGSRVISVVAPLNLQRIRVREGLSMAGALQFYAASPLVADVERHALRYKLDLAPNDPYYSSQWGLSKMKVPEAWGLVPEGKLVVVAVIDTGLDYDHPDLVGQMWLNTAEIPGNQADDDGDGFIDDWRGWDFAGGQMADANDSDNDPMDRDGHGTHVAGIIAARINNGAGVAGVLPKVKLMALKVQADVVSGQETMLTSDIIDAFDYARMKGARIINCSFGGSATSPKEYTAIKSLRDAGILVVAAAGNSGSNMDISTEKTYPAYYGHMAPKAPDYPEPLDNVLSVAAGDSSDQLASFSNYGGSSVDVMAPGGGNASDVGIYSTCLRKKAGDPLYCPKQGTSMATPHVAGLAGLLWSKQPTLTYQQVEAVILGNADTVSGLAGKIVSGGRINAYRSLAAVVLPGDVNNDGRIDLADAVVALQVEVSSIPAGVPVATGANLGVDGRIGLAEALHALQHLADARSTNSPPVLGPMVLPPTIAEGSDFIFIVSARDDDGDSLTYSASGLPEGASFNSETRIFSWRPTASQSGVHPVTFTVVDGRGGSDTRTIQITVTDSL